MVYVGLDLGQRQDHSAIAVVERRDMYRGYANPTFHDVLVRHVERVPLGTPYPKVVERVREVVRPADQCALVVDATGVGMPVVDMLRAARLGCELVPVTITGGDKESRSGQVRMGADGSGEHDDLVIAVTLAVWRARWKPAGFVRGRLPIG